MNHVLHEPTLVTTFAAALLLTLAVSSVHAQDPAATPAQGSSTESAPPPATTGTPATPPTTTKPKPTSSPPSKGTVKSGDKPATTADPNDPESSSKPASGKGSSQRFEPTEKVRPDFDVAFPIDI